MLALALTALLAGASGEPFPSLALELAAPASFQEGLQVQRRPRGFASVGLHWVDEDVRSPFGDEADSDTAFSLDLGLYAWTDKLGFALELGYLPSSYEIDVSALSSDKVDVTRYLLGLRAVEDDPESRFLYHLRGGFAFREDEGDLIDDSGGGWYLGGGMEWKLPAGFSLGPQVLYLDTSSQNATEWIVGLQAAFAF